MRLLLVTIGRHPLDARITRQARALHAAGHAVTLAAPFSAFRTAAPSWADAADLPRAEGRQHRRPLLAARTLIRGLRDHVDLVLLLDAELVLALPRRGDGLPPMALDVHEDLSSPDQRQRLPPPVRPLARPLASWLDRLAEDRLHLLLAEPAFARRFTRPHPVVPDTVTVPTRVPPPGADRVVHVGDITEPRGAADLLEVGRRLRRHGIRTELIGMPDQVMQPALEAAVAARSVEWTPSLLHEPAPAARIDGALACLSLRRDTWAHRLRTPADVLQAMAHGVPTVTTPLPLAAGLVRQHRCGVVVPFSRPDSVVRAVLALRDDPAWRTQLGARGHRAARREHHWPEQAPTFVAQLERWARQPLRTGPG